MQPSLLKPLLLLLRPTKTISRLHQGPQSQVRGPGIVGLKIQQVTVAPVLWVKKCIFAPIFPLGAHRLYGLFWWWICRKEKLTFNTENYSLPKLWNRRVSHLTFFGPADVLHCFCSLFWSFSPLGLVFYWRHGFQAHLPQEIIPNSPSPKHVTCTGPLNSSVLMEVET